MNAVVLSLGGSLIVPDGIDVEVLTKFRQLVLKHVAQGTRFFIICGGGKTCRNYQAAASALVPMNKEDLDWVGIHVTRMNAAFVRMLFKGVAFKHIIGDPTKKVRLGQKDMVVVGAGWEPGWSTDFDAVMIAKTYGVDTIMNLTNVDYAYDKDPYKFKDATKLIDISWRAFRKIVGDTWTPGMNAPFDPIASKQAEKLALKVIITNGRNLDNLERHLVGKPASGTVIH